MATKHTVHIFNETKQRTPRKAIQTIYNDLLKKRCSLTVIYIGDAFSKKLNAAHRNKKKPTNVLTFPPNDTGVAEIYINATMAAKHAKKHGISTKKQILFLYVHGVLHLLGHRHGTKMETLEDRCVTKYI